MKRYMMILLLIAMSFCFPVTSSQAKNEIETIPANIPGVRGDYISKFGFLYVGMPKEYLKNTGYIKGNLVDYYTAGEKEYFVFSNWKTFQRHDTITVVVGSDGKVIRWFKGAKRKNYPSIPVAKVDEWMKK